MVLNGKLYYVHIVSTCSWCCMTLEERMSRAACSQGLLVPYLPQVD